METFLIFGSLGTLVWLAFWGAILYFLWIFIRDSVPALRGIGPELSPLWLPKIDQSQPGPHRMTG